MTPPAPPNGSQGRIESSFRHEYGRLVALLVQRVGVHRLEAVEDAVQAALLAALSAWVHQGVPQNPEAWLYQVAHHHLVGALRQAEGRQRLLDAAAPVEDDPDAEPHAPSFPGEVRDELLRMLFVCCDEKIPPEARLVLSLKTLCGFSTEEIALRLFLTEANVHKRLQRAREKLREGPLETETPPLETLRARIPSVHAVIYVLFNEGYLSTHQEHAIRRELCDESLRLATLLASHEVSATPETFALLALMHFHRARLDARQDESGGLLLLEEQDRARWDELHLQQGARWLEKAAQGETFTRFHAEAGIAAEHSFAPSFAATRWREIAELYALLERLDPSPLHTLNRAVAVAEAEGPGAGLAVLDGVVPPAWLDGHYLWAAVLADLHHRAGHLDVAERFREQALAAAPSASVAALIRRRLRKHEG